MTLVEMVIAMGMLVMFTAVVATVLEGLSLREAGRRHRVSAMTVQRRLKRGLSQMACCLEQDQLSV